MSPIFDRDSPKENSSKRLPTLRLTLLFTIGLAGFSLLPRVRDNPGLQWTLWGTAAILLLFYLVLRVQVVRTGRVLRCEFIPRRSHYVQLTMQSLVYLYWGMYWREVYPFLPLVAAQILFAYALDMLVSWSRGDDWVLGFGPFPIILSTNLFLWFKDDWFFLQFVLVAVGVLGKQFLRWHREGRLVHIFNPSAFSVFVVSVGLLATRTSDLTWGAEIATTISYPPYIYFEIFLLGLIVQYLFSVTLVTLSAAAMLLALNLAYTSFTGVYHSIDNIPVAVFLGLHLLVTDPATSPRKPIGQIIFGALYGVGVFGTYSALRWFDQPTFYDKLLCVPVLNLMVPAFDRFSGTLTSSRLARRVRLLNSDWAFSPQRHNLVHMTVWVFLFDAMMITGFLAQGTSHPAHTIAFWEQACREGRWNGCKTWVYTLTATCQRHSADACLRAGNVLNEGTVVPRDAATASDSFQRACSLGLFDGCVNLHALFRRDGEEALQRACDRGSGESCYTLGVLVSDGSLGLSQNPSRAFLLLRQSCQNDFSRGCGRLAQNYLSGVGTPADLTKAVSTFEKACRNRDASSCAEVGNMYRHGIGVRKDERLAVRRFRQACDLGLASACAPGESAGFLRNLLDWPRGRS